MTKNKKEIEVDKPTNKELLKTYMEGFKDELLGEYDENKGGTSLNQKAYSLGALHAMVGDDGKMQDYELTNKDIIKILRG